METPSSPLRPSEIPEDFAYGSYDKYSSDDPYPRGCRLKRGQPCSINFHSTHSLTTRDSAIVRYGAFENDGAEPSASQEIPIGRGSGRLFGGFIYTPSAEAVSVRLKVQLLDPEGGVMFEIHPPPIALGVQE